MWNEKYSLYCAVRHNGKGIFCMSGHLKREVDKVKCILQRGEKRTIRKGGRRRWRGFLIRIMN